MKARQDITVILELTNEEAKWLKAMMQNPLFGESVTDENPSQRNRRNDLWSVLNNAGVKV